MITLASSSLVSMMWELTSPTQCAHEQDKHTISELAWPVLLW
jgi:hypothetical protein